MSTEYRHMMIEFESLGELYFAPGAVEGRSFRSKYRCQYSVVDWQFRSEKFERFDELSQRWLTCQLGEPMSTVFHAHQQELLNAEKDRRLGIRRYEAA